ncbi:hypothetical protein ANCDUO_00854 [Ancylostoma duodenale]|uniref:Uncharacterized protein n=1 Tax=Ancylostoma duodenale TaxID=51022 RepID=A0A0C2HGP8_9BILA|nr:hypothetical protein ANCDUO_00854 [Ancylostoma duodenale]
MAFDPNKNTWNHNFAEGIKGMEVKLDVLKSTKETQHYEEHKRYVMTCKPRLPHYVWPSLEKLLVTLYKHPNLH